MEKKKILMTGYNIGGHFMKRDLLTNFNTVQPRISLIPAGIIAKVAVKIFPGGYGPNGLLTKSKDTGSIYVNLEFTVVEGPYARRKVYQILGIQGSKLNEKGEDIWGRMGRSMIRSILESARNIYPHDDRAEANLARKIKSISELNGLQCVVKIGIEANIYGEKNKIASVITPEHGSYASFMRVY